MPRLIKLGTRGSKLALIQAYQVRDELVKALPECEIVIVPISTKGDTDKKTPLNELGGKGVFIKELEHALLDKTIDIAVHSLKDVTTELPSELVLSGFLSPEAFTDCLFTSSGLSLVNLPSGSKIGTGSMRRIALIKSMRPDIITIPIRGNVETRLSLCHSGQCDGVILSTAGLYRLKLKSHISEELDPSRFVPAPGQGVIALECRRNDHDSIDKCSLISDALQTEISQFEYSIINTLKLHCGYPYGSYTRLQNNQWYVDIFFMASEKGSVFAKTFTVSMGGLAQLSQKICIELTSHMENV